MPVQGGRVNGLTPKFECELPDGEVVKVKYSGPEPYGEVAASRLLRTLGFGGRPRLVRQARAVLRLPSFPIPHAEGRDAGGRGEGLRPRAWTTTRPWTSSGCRSSESIRGEQIETPDGRGWAFHELAKVPTASRVHADALTLMAVFLAHWDNKPENQRLVCLSGKPARDGRCAKPMAMLQDVGGTFGPRKTDLDGWRGAPIWKDRADVHRQHEDAAPRRRDIHGHDDFREGPAIPGRSADAAERPPQIEALFRGARFDQHDGTIGEWTALFKSRVQASRRARPARRSSAAAIGSRRFKRFTWIPWCKWLRE